MARWPYNTTTWARLAIEPLCRQCHAEGRLTVANTPISEGGHPFPGALWLMMCDIRTWSGTARELLKALLPFRDIFEPDWPRKQATLLSTLTSISPDMETVGIYFHLANAWQLHIRRAEGDVVEIAELTPER